MSIELGDLSDRLDALKIQIDKILRSRKYQFWSLVFVGICFIGLAVMVFNGRKPTDTSHLDKEIELRDQIIAAKDQHIAANDKQHDEILTELTQLKKENLTLMNRYISNQDKHVIINKNKNETNPSLNSLSKDSLRRLHNERGSN